MRKRAFNHVPPGKYAVQLHDRALARSAAAKVLAAERKKKRKRRPVTQRGMDGWRGGRLMQDARQSIGSGKRVFVP